MGNVSASKVLTKSLVSGWVNHTSDDSNCISILDEKCIRVLNEPSWEFKGEGNFSIVFVFLTIPNAVQRRNRIRKQLNTFFGSKGFKANSDTFRVTSMFLIGSNYSQLGKQVDNESLNFGDIVQFSHEETYERIEYKMLAFYEYVNMMVDDGIHIGTEVCEFNFQ